MNRMVIDAALAAKFQQLDGPTELVDAAGHIVAVVSPQYDPALYETVGEELSPEEIDRRCRSDRRIPAAEIIPRLRKLA